MNNQEVLDQGITKRVVLIVNELIRQDPIAMTQLFNTKVEWRGPVTKEGAVEELPYLRTGFNGTNDTIGIIGILNAICNTTRPDIYGPLAVTIEDNGVAISIEELSNVEH